MISLEIQKSLKQNLSVKVKQAKSSEKQTSHHDLKTLKKTYEKNYKQSYWHLLVCKCL